MGQYLAFLSNICLFWWFKILHKVISDLFLLIFGETFFPYVLLIYLFTITTFADDTLNFMTSLFADPAESKRTHSFRPDSLPWVITVSYCCNLWHLSPRLSLFLTRNIIFFYQPDQLVPSCLSMLEFPAWTGQYDSFDKGHTEFESAAQQVSWKVSALRDCVLSRNSILPFLASSKKTAMFSLLFIL